MLSSARERILQTVDDDALVLDVGGWGRPLHRATHVLDLMPYETRGLYGEPDADPERFAAQTWVVRDMCEKAPWPFADGQFAFAVCSHTLEDVRDPVFVCQELQRVARAGYIEVPTRAEEQTYGIQGPWVGWGHHHWLCDVHESGIEFVFKHGIVARAGLHRTTPPAERVQQLWWTGSFAVRERVFYVPEELEAYLAEVIEPEPPGAGSGHGSGDNLIRMAGHSKWAGIKHKKAIVDARRGKLWTKLARAITVAAKDGGGDVKGNPALGLAVQKAKDAQMPKDNIERAIAKGTGAGADAEALETVMYEGYGPGGVAMLVEATTDNRNRTGSDVRHTFSKHGGNLGEPGSVAYLFDKRGLVVVDATRYTEDDLLVAIEAGAEDVAEEDGVFEVLTQPSDLTAVREALAEAEVEVQSGEIAWMPQTRVPLDEATATKVLRLFEALEDNDDVDAVHANFDVDAEVLERVAG